MNETPPHSRKYTTWRCRPVCRQQSHIIVELSDDHYTVKKFTFSIRTIERLHVMSFKYTEGRYRTKYRVHRDIIYLYRYSVVVYPCRPCVAPLNLTADGNS